MVWHCRLYGHQWRHPGTHEVVLLEDDVPAYPFRCAICDSEMLLERQPDDRPESRSGRLETPSTSSLEAEPTPELEGDGDPSEP